MAITRIRVSNFKSFGNLDVTLGPFNVLIGANASGKSNFIQVFKFLRDIVRHGLDNAVSLQGGTAYLRNMRLAGSEPCRIEAVSDQPTTGTVGRRRDGSLLGSKSYETTYTFAIGFDKRGPGFHIAEDKWVQKADVVRLEVRQAKQAASVHEKETLCRGSITIANVGRQVRTEIELPDDAPIQAADIEGGPLFLSEGKLPPKTLLLENPPWPFAPHPFADISIFDFDPKLPKKAVPITGKAELEEDGSNLALVLKTVLANRERRRKLTNLLRDLLPFVESIDVERLADKSLLFKLSESYYKGRSVPASFISDGTVNIAALIVALYFQRERPTIVEEPERNVHPHLISRLMAMMKDAARHKQIIVTTHNPEVVKHAGLDSILLVSRDKEGFSTICRPGGKAQVQTFLENEIGLDELYVQNLLE